MLVNVEIKNLASDGGFDPTMSIAARTVEVLRHRGERWSDRWLISSFSWATIQACRRMAPEIPTAWLRINVDTPAIERVVAAGHTAVHPWERMLDASTVERCHAAGLRVNAWTCNDPDRLVELAAFGVDAVCTDVPAIALDALSRPPVKRGESGKRGESRWSGESREHELHRIGHVGELESPGAAQGVAVDLVRERLVVLHDEPPDSLADVEVRCGLHPSAAQGAGEGTQDRQWRSWCVNVMATSGLSSVAAGDRSSGRFPRYVYGLVLSTIEK